MFRYLGDVVLTLILPITPWCCELCTYVFPPSGIQVCFLVCSPSFSGVSLMSKVCWCFFSFPFRLKLFLFSSLLSFFLFSSLLPSPLPSFLCFYRWEKREGFGQIASPPGVTAVLLFQFYTRRETFSLFSQLFLWVSSEVCVCGEDEGVWGERFTFAALKSLLSLQCIVGLQKFVCFLSWILLTGVWLPL